MPAKSSKTSGSIYQLKITLRDSSPPIWRRVLVPGEFNLYKLHWIVQLSMGWTNSHLHQFIINGQYYGIPHPDDWVEMIDERRVTLSRIAPREKSKFEYEYDFGDSWAHEILVEKILPPEAGTAYPCCVKGKGACPPEDVGGVWGYAEFLEAISDPKHPQHEDLREWVGGDFDPTAFDLEEVNRALRQIK